MENIFRISGGGALSWRAERAGHAGHAGCFGGRCWCCCPCTWRSRCRTALCPPHPAHASAAARPPSTRPAAKVTLRNIRFQGVDSSDAGALAIDTVGAGCEASMVRSVGSMHGSMKTVRRGAFDIAGVVDGLPRCQHPCSGMPRQLPLCNGGCRMHSYARAVMFRVLVGARAVTPLSASPPSPPGPRLRTCRPSNAPWPRTRPHIGFTVLRPLANAIRLPMPPSLCRARMCRSSTAISP